MLDQARSLSSAVDAELDGAIATLASLARVPAMGSGDLRTFYDMASAQVEAQPEWLYRPSVAILDIGLPDIDGYGQKSDVERASSAGFDFHLIKPASLEDLKRAVAGDMGVAS